jgi:hypothetical protein
MFSAKVLADSTNTCDNRLTTMELTYPLIVHAEHLRHRMFSFNVASSRAIPVEKMLGQVWSHPFVPIHWGKAQKGMQAYSELTGWRKWLCKFIHVKLRLISLTAVWVMLKCGLHKQVANRELAPWLWVTVICTGNQGAWNNFWALRCHAEAEPHMRTIAEMSREAHRKSVPQKLFAGQWHLPLIGFEGDELLSDEDKVKVSVGRNARISYLTHDGRRDVQADIDLHDRLLASKHFSPFEHVAEALPKWEHYADAFGGNLGNGWAQYRKTLKGEYQNG